MSAKEKGWKDVPIAGVSWIPSTEYTTGDWRTYQPVLDTEKCIKCLMCFIFCPDEAIEWNSKTEEVKFNYDFCKGCGICANECPTNAIEMVLE